MNAILRTLALLAPAIIPSWRFFKDVAPSPRVEVALTQDVDDEPAIWREFQPRPPSLSIGEMLRRLFWNAPWNESLYLVSLSECLIADEDAFCVQEITDRLRFHLAQTTRAEPDKAFFRFRIVFVEESVEGFTREIGFLSGPEPICP